MFNFEDIAVIIDIADVIFVALIMYYIYRFAKGTHLTSILVGISIIYLLWLVVKTIKMDLLSATLGHIIDVGVIALIVLFQPEIRRFLQMLGNRSMERKNSFWSRLFPVQEIQKARQESLDQISNACKEMSQSKVGALIVIQHESNLNSIIDNGVSVDAVITSTLIRSIFFKNSPLHDGAVVIKGARIAAAKCTLPITSTKMPLYCGLRHRAAMGLSEEVDALIIVVSEETGKISTFQNGTFSLNITQEKLREFILKRYN